jgi:hypothetical protein
VTGSDGVASDSESVIVTVTRPTMPLPVIDADPTATPNPAVVGDTVTFSVRARDPEGGDLTYCWNFGDGYSDWSGAAQSDHVYAKPGPWRAMVAIRKGQTTIRAHVTVQVNMKDSHDPAITSKAMAEKTEP